MRCDVYYEYGDAGGERDLKLIGKMIDKWQNGERANDHIYDRAVLYASELFTVHDMGYSKHYFMEDERIAALIGGRGEFLVDPGDALKPISTDNIDDLMKNYQINMEQYYLNEVNSPDRCYWKGSGAILTNFMSVDLMYMKYPSLTPYHYCGNNPVMRVDPNGNDGVEIIDDESKSITIKATYFVQTSDQTYFTKRGKIKSFRGYSYKQINKMSKINTRLNNLNLTVSEGEYKGYSINFDLQFEHGGTVEECKQKAETTMQDGHNIGNSLTLGNSNIYSKFTSKDNGDGTISTVGGITIDKQHIMVISSLDTQANRMHEIFHTLGFSHPKGIGSNTGIMKYPPELPNQNDAN